MYLSLLPISLLLSLAGAQTTVSPSIKSIASPAPGTSVCAAQPVLEGCLASTEALAAGCASTDYQCLCEKYQSVLVCFNDCPNDSRYGSILSLEETYCNDMSVYLSTTTTPISRPVSSSSAATTTGPGPNEAQTTNSAGAVQTASSTSSGVSSSATGKSGAGSNKVVGAGQFVLGLAGVVGVLL